MQSFFLNIDILGSCNLKCPSCPTGNYKEYKLPTGFMEPAFLAAIVDKAMSECRVEGIGLFNWTEPVLHPRLAEMVRIVQTKGIRCYLSSNLNMFKNMDQVLAENPHSIRISNSGFTQKVYGYSHRGGDIERVKKNMVALAESKKRTSATTDIHVLYHRYRGNLEDEPLMRVFAEGLGFRFQPIWAYLMPLEKILAFVNHDPTEVLLTDEDQELIRNLAAPLDEAVAVAVKRKSEPCSLQDSQITMDHQGNVQLCCAVYDARKFTLAPFLTTPLAELQKLKYAHAMCGRCMKRGVHVYVAHGLPELDKLAANHIAPEHAQLLGLKYERLQKGVRRILEGVAHKTVPSKYSEVLGRKYEKLQSGVRQIIVGTKPKR